jgi:hypothetical protein
LGAAVGDGATATGGAVFVAVGRTATTARVGVREATRASVAGGAPTVGNGVATAGSGVAVMIRSMIHGVCVAAPRAGVGVPLAPHALNTLANTPSAINHFELVTFTTSP